MKGLEELLRLGRLPRLVGFDDAPFDKEVDQKVNLSGIVCHGTQFEGMLWGKVTRDGADATQVVVRMLRESKFWAQVHMVLLDGLGFGGFNLVDLPKLSKELERPCVAVMRQLPNRALIEAALGNLPDPQRRIALLDRAGPCFEYVHGAFQVAGAQADDVAKVLPQVTSQGHVPEALRMAHLIGSAIKQGESSKRA